MSMQQMQAENKARMKHMQAESEARAKLTDEKLNLMISLMSPQNPEAGSKGVIGA